MVQPLLSIPSLSFSQEPVPYYEETARSIEEKTSELEEKIGSSSWSLSDKRQKNRELSLQKAILLAAFQDLRTGKISYDAFTLQCSQMMQTWDETLCQLSSISSFFKQTQEQTLQRLALSTLSMNKHLYPDFLPTTSSYFPTNARLPNLKTLKQRSTLLTSREKHQKDLLQAAMTTAHATKVSLEVAGIGFMGYAILTGGALPLAIGVVGVGSCIYAVSYVIDASMPTSWKEALAKTPERLEEKYGVSQEEVKQFMEDLSFLAWSAVAIPGIRAASQRCKPLLEALARSMKASPVLAETPLLEAPKTWEMYLPENIQNNPYVAFFRDKDPTLYVCSLEKAAATRGLDSGIESSLRTLAQDLKKENVFLTFTDLEGPVATEMAPSLPSFQRLLTAQPKMTEDPSPLFFEQGEVVGRAMVDYFADATIYPSSLDKLPTISLELGKAVGKMHSFPMGMAPVERMENDSKLLRFYYQMVFHLAQDREMTLPHSEEEITRIIDSFKNSTSPIYGFSLGKNDAITNKPVRFEESSSKIYFLKPLHYEPSLDVIPEYKYAEHEFELFGYMVGIGLDATARNNVLEAWRQGYQSAYTHPSPQERATFYKTLAFYECFLDEEALKSPLFFSSLLEAYTPKPTAVQGENNVFPLTPDYQRALREEKNYLKTLTTSFVNKEGMQAVLTLPLPKKRLSSYLANQQAVRTEFPETSYTVHRIEWENHKLISKQAPLPQIQKEMQMMTFFQNLHLSHSRLPTCLAVEISPSSSTQFPEGTLYMTHLPGATLEDILLSTLRSPLLPTSFEPTLAETALYHTAKALAELHGKAVHPGLPHLTLSMQKVLEFKKTFLSLSKDKDFQEMNLLHEEGFIQEVSSAFLANRGLAGYIHGDLHLRNVLFDSHHKQTSLLDVGDSHFYLSPEEKPYGHPLDNLYRLLFLVESLAKEEKASFSFTQRLAHAIYQGYTSENTKFLSKEACRFHHLEHYYQQAALILAEKETLPRQVFIYRMQKTLELLRQEPSGQQLFPIKGQREQEIAPLHPLWDLIDLPAILKGSYRVAQSDTGGKILAVNVDLIQGKQGTTISLIRALAKKVFEEKIDRIQVTAHFQNEELQELLTKRYGLRATKAPWVFELPIEELLKVSPV